MKSEAAFHCKCWACYVLSLFSSFPENTAIGLFLLPVILRSVCSDSSVCNYYSFVCISAEAKAAAAAGGGGLFSVL